jgi:anaerobic selenocysteine-containing dehydrogenase
VEQHSSSCPLDCPDLCGLTVTVDNGRVVEINGDRRGPITDGFVCGKVRKFADHMYGDDRIKTPLIREGAKGSGQFRTATWDEALTIIATRLQLIRSTSGAEAILPYHYGGSNGWLTEGALATRFFRRLGASNLDRTFCASATTAACRGLYGVMPGVALEDYEHAKLIVLWGINPTATGIHLVPVIERAIAAGAKLVVVDPRKTPLARRADLHLPIRPGADVPVALAVINALFARGHANRAFLAEHAAEVDEIERRAARWSLEDAAREAGLEVAQLDRFVELYAESSPAVIRVGNGLERNRNGGSAVAAVLSLPTIAGKFGVRGGGYTMAGDARWGVSDQTGIAEPKPATRTVNMSQISTALQTLTAPRIECLFVYNCNPAVTVPDQRRILRGLEREDLFTVVFEQVMTDTALYADVILPATTFLEGYDFARAYGPVHIDLGRPVIEPIGEARSNADVFGELCSRLNLLTDDDAADELALLVNVLDQLPAAVGADLRDGRNPVPAFGTNRPVQFVDVFPKTCDQKIDLFPAAFEASAPAGLYRFQPDPATAAYPLTLISPASERTISSTLGELPRPDVKLLMHPDDAAGRGLADNDLVRMFNDLGEVHCTLSVLPTVRPGTVSLPKGLWRRSTRNGVTGTALVPDTLTDIGGGACFNDARVQVVSLANA